MSGIFVDTGFWVGFVNPSDALHPAANHLAPLLSKRKWITSDLVLAEFLNQFASAGEFWRTRAADYARSAIIDNSRITVVESTPELLNRAIALYSNRPDKAWGLTDCVSFLIMEDCGITDALAYDIHFAQAGFVAMMRAAHLEGQKGVTR